MKKFNRKSILSAGRKSILSAGTSALVFGAMAIAAHAQVAAPATATLATPTDSEKPSDTLVVITARRKALQTATERKKNSDTVIESVVADDAGKLPDNSITEVLQRVVGVTIVHSYITDPNHFLAEGTGIQVRGLNGVAGLLNGREVFSANGGAGISWGEVTPELMAAVDVYKANRADMIEGGTGGTVDLRTKMPFDYKKPEFDLSFGDSYGDMSKKQTPSMSGLYTKRFDTPIGDIGFLVDLAYSEQASKDNFERPEVYYSEYNTQLAKNVFVPGGLDYGDDSFDRKRGGLYEALQWRPNDNLTFFQTAFVTEYKSTTQSTEVDFGLIQPGTTLSYPSSDAKYDSNGALVSGTLYPYTTQAGDGGGTTIGQGWIPADQQVDCTNSYGSIYQTLDWSVYPPTCTHGIFTGTSSQSYSTSNNITADFSQGFTWVNDKLKIQGALQHIVSTAKSKSMSLGLLSTSTDFTSYSVDLSGTVPSYSLPESAELQTRKPYTWNNISYVGQSNRATMSAVNLDVDYDLGGGFFKSLRTGFRLADHIEHDAFSGTYWAPLGNNWDGYSGNLPITGTTHAGDTELYTFSNFFEGKIKSPGNVYMPSIALLKTFDWNYVMQQYGYNHTYASPADSLFNQDPANMTTTRVQTASAYIESNFGHDPFGFLPAFTGNIGVRFSQFRFISSGFETTSRSTFYETTYNPDGSVKETAQQVSNDDLAANSGVATDYQYLPNTAVARSADNTFTRALPSINVNFKPSDKFYIRVAIGQTMSPPNYGDMRASSNISANTNLNGNNTATLATTDADGNTVISGGKTYPGLLTGYTLSLIGNPKLKPTMSTNYDLSMEWYQSNSFNAHVALFHKDLKDVILYESLPGQSINVTTYNAATNAATTSTINATLNGNENLAQISHLTGLELGMRKFFDNWKWKGFGFEGNFTYIDSHAPAALAYDMTGNRITNLPLPALSKYNYNLSLLYNHNDWDVRLAYTWRSNYLQSAAGWGTLGSYTLCTAANYANSCLNASGLPNKVTYSLPTYGDSYGSLDAGVNYKINAHARISFQASNLLNAYYKTKMEIKQGLFYTRSYYMSDRRANISLLMNF